MNAALEIGTVEVGAEVAFSVQAPCDGRAEVDLFYIVGDTVEVVGLPVAKATQLRDLLTAALDFTPPGSGDAPAVDVAVEPAGAPVPEFELGPVDDTDGELVEPNAHFYCDEQPSLCPTSEHAPAVEQDPDVLDQLGVAATGAEDVAPLCTTAQANGVTCAGPAAYDLVFTSRQTGKEISRERTCHAHGLADLERHIAANGIAVADLEPRPDADGDLIAPAKEA